MKYIELLDGIDPNWTIKEKVRYLYQNIAKNSKYDERMNYSQDAQLLKEIYYRDVDIRQDEDARLVCNSANKVFFQLLEEEKIKAKLIYKKSFNERAISIEDVALTFFDEEGREYYTNIVGDFENCRFGLATNYFGIINTPYEEAKNVNKIPFEELKEIDIKTGTIKGDYNNIAFQLLANEVKNTGHFKRFLQSQGIQTNNLSHEEILEYKMQYLTRLVKFRDKQAGPFEQKQFYKRLFRGSILDKFESKKFFTFEFIKEKNKELDIISVIVIPVGRTYVYYAYTEEEQTYTQIPIEDLLQRLQGYREIKERSIPLQGEFSTNNYSKEDMTK